MFDIKVYREENKEKLKAYRKQYWINNKERLSKAKREEYRRNIGRYKVYGKEYHQKNKEKHNKNSHENYIKNKPYYNAKIKKYRHASKHRVLEHYTDGKFTCRLCGFPDKRALCIDHVNDNGAEDRRTMTGSGIYAHIIRQGYPKDYQVLCANCNMIKEMERRAS